MVFKIDQFGTQPIHGMVYLPQGSFNMGPGDQDVPDVTQHKQFLLQHFIWTKQKLRIMNIVSCILVRD